MSDELFTTGVEYPFYQINNGGTLPNHILKAMSKILEPQLGVVPDYAVYVKMPDGNYKIGDIVRTSVKSFLSLVTPYSEIELHLDESHTYTGDMIYILS